MAQPWSHHKTGVYWFRRVVPRDLRELVGKREELASLGTKDIAEARVRHAKMSAEVEARWANLRSGQRQLTEREALALAAQAHDTWLRWHEDEPSEQFGWHLPVFRKLWTKTLVEPSQRRGETIGVPFEDFQVRGMRALCFAQADNVLAHHGLQVDEHSRLKLAKAVGTALQRASLTVADLASGRFTSEQLPIPIAQTDPSVRVGRGAHGPKSRLGSQTSLTMAGLFEAWWREAEAAGRKPSTHESYSNTVKALVRFLRHDDATRITAEDIVAFKDHRLTTPSPRTGKVPSPKTVKDSDLSALKTLFSWAVMNRRLPVNPATGLTIKVGRKARIREKGFVESEAKAILSAALAYEAGSREHPKTAAAKRWVPWLCAFSGARVGEIAQLRRQDVRKEGDLWVVRITPEAGTVKTNEAREFVLHQQLINLGFPEFVDGSAGGHLFVAIGEDGDVAGPLSGLLNRIREFVRAIVPDPLVQPNHGWRHLFTTLCIDAGIEARVYNAIQGHAGRTVADQYGDVSLKAKAVAIGRLPWFEVLIAQT